MVYLNSESYRRFYLSNLYSLTTIFCVIMYIITFTFPFFLAFSTQNMWLRDTIYLEQPIVQIRDEAIVYALDDEVTKSYSSVAILDSTYTSKLPGVSVSSISYDDDDDGRADVIKGTISMLADPTTLQALQIYLFFDYGLRDWAKVQMQDYLRFDVSSSLGIRSVDIIGDIVLNQKIVIRSSSTVRTTYNKTVFLDPYLVVNADFLAQNKSQKNYAIECDCEITSAPGLLSNGPVTVTFELHVPKQQKILYAPSILENAKLSWILYLSYLIPIYWLTQRVMNFAFRNKIFGNYVLNNLPFEKSKTD